MKSNRFTVLLLMFFTLTTATFIIDRSYAFSKVLPKKSAENIQKSHECSIATPQYRIGDTVFEVPRNGHVNGEDIPITPRGYKSGQVIPMIYVCFREGDEPIKAHSFSIKPKKFKEKDPTILHAPFKISVYKAGKASADENDYNKLVEDLKKIGLGISDLPVQGETYVADSKQLAGSNIKGRKFIPVSTDALTPSGLPPIYSCGDFTPSSGRSCYVRYVKDGIYFEAEYVYVLYKNKDVAWNKPELWSGKSFTTLVEYIDNIIVEKEILESE